MKKLIFAGFAVLLVFAMATCDGLIPNVNGEEEYTNVEFADGGKSVTIYLDGTTVPVTKQSRALNTERSRMGHDYYEVVFVHNSAASVETVTRATWEYGQSVSIAGIVRGVAYSTVNVPAAGAGSAVLFVGRKDDMTLLAVGKISAVNGTLPATTVFDADTKSVTFELAALQAGTSMTLANSSFLTSNDGTAGNISVTNTAVESKTVVGTTKTFPMFKIPLSSTIAAQYQLGSAGTNAGPAMADLAGIGNLADYINGIKLVAPITGSTASSPNLIKRDPRFPYGGGLYTYISGGLGLDEVTTITPTTAGAADGTLPNPIQFTFASSAQKSIFSFFFEIPVYAISKTAGNQAMKTWNVRPAYGTTIADLDDGLRGPGGCILIGTGIDTLDPIEIKTTK